jgi:hypothetical protein
MRRQSDERVPTNVITSMSAPASDAIATRAYDLYQQRDREDGHDLEDWLEAERQVTEERRREAVTV